MQELLLDDYLPKEQTSSSLRTRARGREPRTSFTSHRYSFDTFAERDHLFVLDDQGAEVSMEGTTCTGC
jgi:hypothetical protein